VTVQTPGMLPVLSRGRHRNPRKGGCFMELASYLAGERWSDHPACTHPLLAALARHVNDLTTDAGRPALAPLIPSVIGLRSADARVDVRLALLAATTALPVVSEERQHVLALSVLTCAEVLVVLDGRVDERAASAWRTAEEQAPGAFAWARAFRSRVAGDRPVSVATFRRHTAPHTVRCAAEGISAACVSDPEPLLRDLLAVAIDECRRLVPDPSAPAAAHDERWEEACRLVGVAT
jgi:hypothetical protein